MQKSNKKVETIPSEFKTLREASEFWDTHDASDYWDMTGEARFKSTLKKETKYVALEGNIAKKIFSLAKKHMCQQKRSLIYGSRKSCQLLVKIMVTSS